MSSGQGLPEPRQLAEGKADDAHRVHQVRQEGDDPMTATTGSKHVAYRQKSARILEPRQTTQTKTRKEKTQNDLKRKKTTYAKKTLKGAGTLY